MGWKDAPVVEAGGGGGSWRDAPEAPLLDRAGRYVKGALKAVGQGVTLGYGDEIGAAIDATLPGRELISSVRPISQAESWGQRYDENLARERGEAKQFADQNPVTSTAANVAGNVGGAYGLSLLPVAGGLFIAGRGLLQNVAKGAAVGAGLGGVQGFGEGEGGFDNRLRAAETGAVVGGALGGSLPVAGSAAGYAYEKFAPTLLNKIADVGERFVPKGPATSLSAAAPEGGQIPHDSWITRTVDAARAAASKTADAARTAATKTTEDAAVRRLALEIERSGGVKQVGDKLADLGEGAFIADASRGTRRLAEVGTMLPGEAGEKYTAAFGQRNAQTGRRFLNAMGEQANVPSVYDTQRYLEAFKRHTGSELYDPVLRGGNFNVSPEMQRLLDSNPAIRETMDQIIAEGEKHGVQLGAAEAAHMVKRQLNQNADAAFQAGKAVNRTLVGNTGDAWERALWEANPAIREADTAYAKVASLPDWLERGQNFMRTGQGETAVGVSPAALANDIPNATPEQLMSLRVGASNVMRDAATQGPEATRRLGKGIADNEIMQQKLAEIYGPQAADRLAKQAATERAFQETRNRVLAGSPTAERLAAAADDAAVSIPQGGGAPTNPASILQLLLDKYQQVRQPSEGVRSRLADLLATSDAASNQKTLRLVEEILRQQAAARPISAGIAGATGGNFSSPR